jgi:HK97 family phage prohead protease
MERECRFSHSKIHRIRRTDGQDHIGGYAAVFNKLSNDLGGFRERVKTGAFSDYLRAGGDVVALFNHDPNFVLGRRRSGTLRVSEDQRGLRFEADPAQTNTAQHVLELIDRGDVSQCSFSFRCLEDEWTEEPDPSIPGRSIKVRLLKKVNPLFDVSLVTFPAYPDTSCDVRALFPDGVPDHIRWHIPTLGSSTALVRNARHHRIDLVEGRSIEECLAREAHIPNDVALWLARLLPVRAQVQDQRK